MDFQNDNGCVDDIAFQPSQAKHVFRDEHYNSLFRVGTICFVLSLIRAMSGEMVNR